jgi:hypothetical protein
MNAGLKRRSGTVVLLDERLEAGAAFQVRNNLQPLLAPPHDQLDGLAASQLDRLTAAFKRDRVRTAIAQRR